MIDSKLIAAHQWIVDETEKKPIWLAGQVIYPGLAMDLVIRALLWKSNWYNGVMLIMLLAFGTLLIAGLRNEAIFKTLGESTAIRMLLVGLGAFQTATLFIAPSGIHFLYAASGLLTASYYYFAACEAPRPKKRKLVLKTA